MKYENDRYYIIRTNRAGVFFAKIGEQDGNALELIDCRKIWYWDGANGVEQLAIDGSNRPMNCKLTVSVPSMIVVDPIQIIPCTDKAVKILSGVREWRL